jgi:hypothetical protein
MRFHVIPKSSKLLSKTPPFAMRILYRLLFVLLIAVTVYSCGSSGASSLPELSNMVISAFSSKDSTKIWKTTPSESQMEVAMKDYFSNEYKTADELKQVSLERTVNNQVSLLKEYQKVKQTGRQAGIDWSKVKLANFSFGDNKTVDAYKKATVSLTIFGGTAALNTIQFEAVQYDGRWFIYDGNLRWMKKK